MAKFIIRTWLLMFVGVVVAAFQVQTMSRRSFSAGLSMTKCSYPKCTCGAAIVQPDGVPVCSEHAAAENALVCSDAYKRVACGHVDKGLSPPMHGMPFCVGGTVGVFDLSVVRVGPDEPAGVHYVATTCVVVSCVGAPCPVGYRVRSQSFKGYADFFVRPCQVFDCAYIDTANGDVPPKGEDVKLLAAACRASDSDDICRAETRAVHARMQGWGLVESSAKRYLAETAVKVASALHAMVTARIVPGDADTSVRTQDLDNGPDPFEIVVNVKCACRPNDEWVEFIVDIDDVASNLRSTCSCFSGVWLAYAGHSDTGAVLHNVVCKTYTWHANDVVCFRPVEGPARSAIVYVVLPGACASASLFEASEAPASLPARWTTSISKGNRRYYTHTASSGATTSTYTAPTAFGPASVAMFHALRNGCGHGGPTHDMLVDMHHPGWTMTYVPGEGPHAAK
ncbi:MAG: hypothetical protein VW491_01315 [Gammaproteobacteria bacterium]